MNGKTYYNNDEILSYVKYQNMISNMKNFFCNVTILEPLGVERLPKKSQELSWLLEDKFLTR